MVQVFFELPSDMAATLQNQANHEQSRIDDIVDLALREYLEIIPSEEIVEARDFALRPDLVHKAKTIAAKAHVNVDAVVQIALKDYFSQNSTAYETLPAILQRLTGIEATNA